MLVIATIRWQCLSTVSLTTMYQIVQRNTLDRMTDLRYEWYSWRRTAWDKLKFEFLGNRTTWKILNRAERGEGKVTRKISNGVDYVTPVAINDIMLSVKNPVFPVFLVLMRRVLLEAEREGGSSGAAPPFRGFPSSTSRDSSRESRSGSEAFLLCYNFGAIDKP